MGVPTKPQDVLLIVAAFSRYPEALAWAEQRLTTDYGPIALASEPFTFVETNYYESTMGPELRKQFWAFSQQIDPAWLVDIKLKTNGWEQEYAELGKHAEPRPLNLDPGYITPAKLVLASTKDHAHRLYLGKGIYAEVTLYYKAKQWQARDWTFPDYRRADYAAFFQECRKLARN